MTTKEEYKERVKLHNKLIKFRKWKVKDKNKFIANKDDLILGKEALVYDCLENKNLALSEEEYKFMLIQIREKSLSKKIQFTFKCGVCSTEFDYTANLTEIIKPTFEKYGTLESDSVVFQMQRVPNRVFYSEVINSCESDSETFIADFILHVKSYNGNDALSFNDINEIINEMDIELFEDIFKQWEQMRFKTSNISDVKCSTCGSVETYEFDDLPGFFPESWNINA